MHGGAPRNYGGCRKKPSYTVIFFNFTNFWRFFRMYILHYENSIRND